MDTSKLRNKLIMSIQNIYKKNIHIKISLIWGKHIHGCMHIRTWSSLKNTCTQSTDTQNVWAAWSSTTQVGAAHGYRLYIYNLWSWFHITPRERERVSHQVNITQYKSNLQTQSLQQLFWFQFTRTKKTFQLIGDTTGLHSSLSTAGEVITSSCFQENCLPSVAAFPLVNTACATGPITPPICNYYISG